MIRRGHAAALVLGIVTTACGGPAEPSADAPAVIDLALEARAIALQPATLEMTAGPTLVISFDNADPGTPHGLILYGGPGLTTKVAEAPILTGPARLRYEVGPLVPGRYRFSCVVHPPMTADLTVRPAG